MRRPTRLPCSRSTCDERLLVVPERLRQEPRSRRLMPEYVGEPHLVAHPLHARLQQLQVRSIPQAQLIQTLRFSLADIAGRGFRIGIRVFVMAPQRVPMLVARALDRVTDVVAAERHRSYLTT